MNTLAIDTSNDELGVAITKEGRVIGELITTSKQDHSTRLMPAIVNLMERTNTLHSELDAIIVTHGPGSYTGSRIGITTAKTMAWGLNIPVYTVSSLALLAMNGRLTSFYICPFFNARRQAVFTGLYKWQEDKLMEIEAECNVTMEDWLAKLKLYNEPILFLSPHMDVFKEMIEENIGQQAIMLDETLQRPLPSNLHTMIDWTEEVNVHQVVPNYLRKTEAETKLQNKQKDE